MEFSVPQHHSYCSADCQCTTFATENAKFDEHHQRNKRRQKWAANRKISADRATVPIGQFHYFDEYLETALPSEFDQHYKCDNCKQNHIEEDCPSYRNHNPHARVVKGKQRMGHIDTKIESINSMKGSVVQANNDLALEDEKLVSGHKFCTCCCYLISPENFGETVVSHPGKVADIGEPHESYRYAVYGFTCCEKSADAPGCCSHTHVFK